MSALSELLREQPAANADPTVPVDTSDSVHVAFPYHSVREEQIHELVHQLFLRHNPELTRNIGITPAEPWQPTASLCLDVARVLGKEGQDDVGLIDANPDSIPLQEQLQILAPAHDVACWPIAPRLWLIPRSVWWPDTAQPVTNQNLDRLRELTAEFDFSILHCPPVSWLTARIGQVCDGLVLVLTANKTRRVVAAQIKRSLNKTNVPLLGTVLAERRFPLPQRLYRSL